MLSGLCQESPGLMTVKPLAQGLFIHSPDAFFIALSPQLGLQRKGVMSWSGLNLATGASHPAVEKFRDSLFHYCGENHQTLHQGCGALVTTCWPRVCLACGLCILHSSMAGRTAGSEGPASSAGVPASPQEPRASCQGQSSRPFSKEAASVASPRACSRLEKGNRESTLFLQCCKALDLQEEGTDRLRLFPLVRSV